MSSQVKELAAGYNLSLDDVAEWCGLHYGRDFYTESTQKRIEWIQRYAEMHGLISSVDKVAEAGELLIRAASVLGTMLPVDQKAYGELILLVTAALHEAASKNGKVGQSLRTHPPTGLAQDLCYRPSTDAVTPETPSPSA